MVRSSSSSRPANEIVWAMTIPQMDEEKHDMTLNVKGDMIETEMDLGAQGGIKMWVDRAAKKTYMYMAALGNKGMIMDMPNDSAAAKQTENIDIKPTPSIVRASPRIIWQRISVGKIRAQPHSSQP